MFLPVRAMSSNLRAAQTLHIRQRRETVSSLQKCNPVQLSEVTLMGTKLAGVILVAVLCFSLRAFPQGSLTPPAAPTPTMKTLDQIRSTGIAINSANTPGNGSNQFIISSPGSYYLTGIISGVSGKNGILITNVDVSIDLNGFSMIGSSGGLAGITDGGVSGVGEFRIHNGMIRNWGGAGIDIGHSANSIIANVIVAFNGGNGMNVGDGCVLRDCLARNNSSDNILTGSNAAVTHCSAVGSANGSGINLGQDSTLSDCAAILNKVTGILTAADCTVSNSTASENSGGGIAVGQNNTVTNCTASKNVTIGGVGSGIFGGNGCTFLNCTASNNTVQWGLLANPGSTVKNCTVSYNTSAQSTSGGILASGSTVESCTVFSNGTTAASTSHLTGMGIYTNGGDSTIRHCTIWNSAGSGINVAAQSLVQNNLVADSGADGGGAIETADGDSQIEGNQVLASPIGILVSGKVNLIIHNTARGNASNYSIVAGNRVGTIVVPATSSASGNTGGAAVSTDSWVNIAF